MKLNGTKPKRVKNRTMSRTYIGISRDHSISMRSLTKAAARDFNECVSSIKDAAIREKQAAVVSVVECGAGSTNTCRFNYLHAPVQNLSIMPENKYIANGTGTPLFDSVGELITLFEKVKDKNATFLIMVITDGEENASRFWDGRTLASKIRLLQYSDQWTFTFRVPRGYVRNLTVLGIPAGNILEWDQTDTGMETATKVTTSAVANYFKGVASGQRSTQSFYADLSGVTPNQVKDILVDVSKSVKAYPVKVSDPIVIKDFVEQNIGTFQIGTVYYQLTKSEKVQDHKNIIIYVKKSRKYYSGQNARDLLGIPHSGTIHLLPAKYDAYTIFVQSTSYNRKLVSNTKVLSALTTLGR